MITLRMDQAARMLGGQLRDQKEASRIFTGVSIDSRSVRSGELFVAVRGENNDGHDYISQAVEKGAAGVVAENVWLQSHDVPADLTVVEVNDSHEAMMLMAEAYRLTLNARFVGITGSNGKTTTKEFTHRLISAAEDDVYRSPGNYNNLFGMPLALFAMPESVRVAVMEMGISLPGEMTRLTRIVRPDIAVFTNVGPSHLQFLSTVEGVARAKLEMVSESPDTMPVIVNADSPVLMAEAGKLRQDLITFGLESRATFMAERIESDSSGQSTVVIEGHSFRLPLFGRYQVYNLLAAYAVFRTLGYRFDGIDTVDIRLTTAPMRGEVMERGGLRFIADCYNANPDSVKSGLTSFARQRADGRRVIILGDMLELGDDETRYHREIGQLLGRVEFDRLILVGPLSWQIMEAAVATGVPEEKIIHYNRADECATDANDLLKPGDLVFIKGSRGIGLEAIINAVSEEGGED